VEENALYCISSGTVCSRICKGCIGSFNLPLSKESDSVIRKPCPFLGGGGWEGSYPYDQPLTII
jgi:hypothetical protein